MNAFLQQLSLNENVYPDTTISANDLYDYDPDESIELPFENQTLMTIHEGVYISLIDSGIFRENDSLLIEFMCSKLAGYRYVDEIYQLHRGKHIRWIRKHFPTTLESPNNVPKLTIGGIVVDIKIMDTGVHILCKVGSRYIQYKFDDCLTYQKLSTDEMMFLAANRLLSK